MLSAVGARLAPTYAPSAAEHAAGNFDWVGEVDELDSCMSELGRMVAALECGPHGASVVALLNQTRERYGSVCRGMGSEIRRLRLHQADSDEALQASARAKPLAGQ